MSKSKNGGKGMKERKAVLWIVIVAVVVIVGILLGVKFIKGRAAPAVRPGPAPTAPAERPPAPPYPP